MDKFNSNLKIDSFARKTEALDEIARIAKLALANCAQPDVAALIDQIVDRAEITNELYGTNPQAIELSTRAVSQTAKTNPYLRSVNDILNLI